MCGRFAVGDPDRAVWAEWLGTEGEGPWAPPNWNVAPTQEAAIVTDERGPGGGRVQRLARWGLVPRWWKKPLGELKASTFNARSEEAAGKPMFRDAWARARCLVPALGYYEWTGKPGAKRAYFVTLQGNAPGVAFAGLWAEARVEGERVVSFTILTCPAGPGTDHLHPRAPVILDPSDWAGWLERRAEPGGLMRAPAAGRVSVREVDPRVGRVSENGPGLLEPVGLDL